MPKSLSESIPVKYRHLQKRLDAIDKTLRSLPHENIDFFALLPKQRDLIEIYYRCIVESSNKDNLDRNDKVSEKDKLDQQTEIFRQELKKILSEDEICELVDLLNDPPQIIQRDYDMLPERRHPAKLMHFLSEQQDLYAWIPGPGRLWPPRLTWVAWDELLTLMMRYGYDQDADDTSKVKSLSEWQTGDKRQIIHLYLEMIVSDEIRNEFRAVQNYVGEPPPIRQRLPVLGERRSSGISYRRRKTE